MKELVFDRCSWARELESLVEGAVGVEGAAAIGATESAAGALVDGATGSVAAESEVAVGRVDDAASLTGVEGAGVVVG